MSRSAWLAGTLAALAAGAAGYAAGNGGNPVPALADRARSGFTPEPAKAAGPVIYYRDPDGKPAYAAAPMLTGDGRAFRAVHAGEDVSFELADEGDATSSDTAADMAGHGLDTQGLDMHGLDTHGSARGGAAGSGARRVLYYRNPMGLPDTSPVPKKDAMGMDYVPVYAGEDEAGVVRVSPARVQRTGVRTEAAERRVVTRPLRVPGTVALDERRVTVIATRSDAYVDRVENVTTGDRIRKGQALVHVYAPEINAAAAQLIANPGFDGARRRLQNLNVSEAVIDEMERTRKVPMAVTWSSARDGIVLARNAVEGMKAAAGDTLFRIGDTSLMWVLADVPERDLAGVRVGQPVAVRLRSAPGRTLSGTVGAIYPQVNPETRATRVRIELPNPDGALLPDMYADVEIATGDPDPVVAVPEDAVIDTGERQVVLLDRGEGRFEPRAVQVGRRGGGHVEIRDGVSAGERVVTAANFLIDAESNLRAALQGMTAPADDRQASNAGATP